ncbi:MAG TPA: hypothetical protein DHN33_01330 [Eubacteriaceae bacterium]|nr:hypothetical protein [Eubacteriaceae bacterium]
MEIEKIEEERLEKYKEEIWELLVACDEEFVPPLSDRNSSTQAVLNQEEKEDQKIFQKPVVYYRQMIQQEFIVCTEKGTLIGFLTYINGYDNEIFERHIGKENNKYVTTICVQKEHRGKNIAGRLYDALETIVKSERKGVLSTRTWSTNRSHIKILKRKGFENIETLKDHRGKGIDTVYYLKKL